PATGGDEMTTTAPVTSAKRAAIADAFAPPAGMATSSDDRRELARRVSSGIEVTLYWNALDNSTTIEVSHAASDETFAYVVAGERALDAFYHPFAHLPISPD